MPSINLELSKFSTEATKWGCEHESVAREKYKTMYQPFRNRFSLTESGLFIHPFMGASPDGLVSYLCCSEDVCEI